MYPTSPVGLIDFALVKRTAGNYSAASTTWANLDTGLDLTVIAAVGDLIEVNLSALHGNEAQQRFVDVATVVGGSLINWFGSGEPTTTTGEGLMGFGKESGSPIQWNPIGGCGAYIVQAGDISGGKVTLRLRHRTSVSASTLYAVAADPLIFWAKVFRKSL